MDDDEPPGQGVAVLDLAHDHLRDEHAEQHGTGARRCPGSSRRSRQRKTPTTRKPIPKTAVARTCTYTVSVIAEPEPPDVLPARMRPRRRRDRARDDEHRARGDARPRRRTRSQRGPAGWREPARVAPRLDATTTAPREDDEGEQEVRHHGDRVEVEQDRDAAERDLGDRPESASRARRCGPSAGARRPAARRARSISVRSDPDERDEAVAELDRRVPALLGIRACRRSAASCRSRAPRR